MEYPQYQSIVPRQGGGGGGESGGWWQSLQKYFCGGGGGLETDAPVLIRVFIPPNVDIKLPEKETEKYGPTGEKIDVNEIDKKPSKPFYFVLPPNQVLPSNQVPPYNNYYYPNTQIIQPSVFPNLIRSNSFPPIFNANTIAQRINSLKTKIDGSDANDKMYKSN